MARLTMRRGPEIGAIYVLAGTLVTIGRGAKNDIVIVDNEVSRNHCRLVRTPAGYELEDLGSQSGTFVNGRRISGSQVLNTGSLIELGDTITLYYEFDPSTLVTQSVEMPVVPPFVATSDDTFYLMLRVGPEPERIYPLKADQITIGRDLSNDIVVQDPEVSRWHLRLTRSAQGYDIEDTGSTNGTRVNGRPLTGVQPLHVNDRIELAQNSRLRYVLAVDAQPLEIDAADDNSGASPDNQSTRATLRPDFMPMPGQRTTTRLGTGIPQGSLVGHVFLAYAREDWEAIVAPLMVALQDGGVKVWVEQYLVQGGDDWRAAVEQAMHECWLMVLVVSPQALQSRYVKLEYRYFINREKPLLLFHYRRGDTVPAEFANLPAVTYDPENSKRSFQRLILEILHRRP
jgi:pSer/pThr/pTyr-binding forkhead associated (FHA) protein